MNKTKTNTDFELVTLLNEIHEQSKINRHEYKND